LRPGFDRGLEVLLVLDADAGEDLAEPADQVRVGLAQAGRAGQPEEAADDLGVQDHGDSEADAERLDRRIAVEVEAAQPEPHDHCRGGDHATAGKQPADQRTLRILARVGVLLDLADQEHLEVHRAPETARTRRTPIRRSPRRLQT